MRVYVVRSPFARNPLARFALGLAAVLALVGIVLVVLPLLGIALAVALVGVVALALAGLVMRFFFGKRLQQAAEAATAQTAGPSAGQPRRWRGSTQDVQDVEVVEVVRELDRPKS